MENMLSRKNITEQIGFGLTGAALTGSFALCACAVTGQGLWAFLLCCTVCIFSSLLNKDNVFAPTPLFLVPVICISTLTSPACAGISVFLGSIFYFIFKKKFKRFILPDFIKVGAILGLALASTIIFTNDYFGIGARGATPLETLAFYRSLGFHPNFRGLLYGTITLFAMITFPFKFKKLNKYLPAPFITILIPFILNLFLNPQKDLTTINEAVSLTLTPISFEGVTNFSSVQPLQIPIFLMGGLILGAFFVILDEDEKGFTTANIFNGLLSFTPVNAYKIRGYGIISAITSLITIAFITFVFPEFISRLPMHTAGAMLIVASWQSVPFSALSKIFKRRKPFDIMVFAVCSIAFVSLDFFNATAIIFTLSIFINRKAHSAERSVTK
ncbi:MAG: hypothetical protein J6D06_11325 [Clostridia bacterium]|nr:hypothetical protein [Clostridia bacterium]